MGSMGDSSSEISAAVNSDRVAMVMDGDWVTGVTGSGCVSGAVTDSSGGD